MIMWALIVSVFLERTVEKLQEIIMEKRCERDDRLR